MVGTTEREVSEPLLDPIPTHEEIAEVFRRLKKDIAGEGFERSDCHYAFAGVRTLPVRSGGGSVTRMSRKHRWVHQDGMLSLLGGKLTTAVWTVQEGLRQVFQLAGLQRSPVDITGRLLPGSALLSDSVRQFKSEAQAFGISQEAVDTAIARYGSRVRFFCEDKELLEEVVPGVIRGEVKMAFLVDQAQTLEDFMRRRLGLEYKKGNGVEHLNALIEAIQEFRPDLDLQQQKQDYINRMTLIHDSIQGSSTSAASN
jgi:glycerol-3-phosphate dehydrogenase